MSTSHHRHINRLLAYAMLVVILFWLVLAMAGCAPKNSHKHFHKPKYSVTDNARNGRPSVRQTWWKSWWIWTPFNEKKPTPLDP